MYKTLVFLILVFSLTSDVFADKYNYSDFKIIENNFYSYNVSGVAMAMAAAEKNFDYSTFDWQWSAGASKVFFDNPDKETEAFSIGIGKRFEHLMINSSYSKESGSEAISVGATGKFK